MARKKRQLVMMGPDRNGSAGALGARREVRETFARFNTAPDGSNKDSMGLERLHGPGMVVEIATSVDPVTQAVASINDEDIALPVLFKLCKTTGWRLMDMESGRIFGG